MHLVAWQQNLYFGVYFDAHSLCLNSSQKKLCSLPCLTRLKTWKLNFLPRFGGDEFTPPPTLLPKKKGWRGLAKRCSDVIFVSRPLKAAEMSLRRRLSEFASPPPPPWPPFLTPTTTRLISHTPPEVRLSLATSVSRSPPSSPTPPQSK